MKINWKKVAMYVLRVIEMIVTGAAGGDATLKREAQCCNRLCRLPKQEF